MAPLKGRPTIHGTPEGMPYDLGIPERMPYGWRLISRPQLSASIAQFGPHLERGTADNSEHYRLHCVIAGSGIPDDLADDGHVDRLEAAAQGVNQHFLGQGSDEHVRPAEQRVAQRRGPVHLRPVR